MCENIRSSISRYLFCSQIFSGTSGIFGYIWVYPFIIRFSSNIYWGLRRLQQNQTVLDRFMSSTVILDVKMADFAIFLHPGVLFVGPSPREEHLMMVLFSWYRWYPKYWVIPNLFFSKTESGQVGYRKKYRVAGGVWVPPGHWTSRVPRGGEGKQNHHQPSSSSHHHHCHCHHLNHNYLDWGLKRGVHMNLGNFYRIWVSPNVLVMW